MAAYVRNQINWQKEDAKYREVITYSYFVIINSPGNSVNADNAIVDLLDEKEKVDVIVKTI